MPLVESSLYRPPWFCIGAHCQTILPNLTRRRWKVEYERELIELEDGDFFDVDWARGTSRERNLLIILHGLEGSSRAPYVVSMARAAREAGYAVAALNFRGCSGEMNRLPRFYHSGDTGDLRELVSRVGDRYDSVSFVGFSLGGNVLLKYMGENVEEMPRCIRAAVAFSVPCHLSSSAEALERFDNKVYMRRFIRMLCHKVEEKERLGNMPLASCGCRVMRTFREFDGGYTAPLHGFRSADDYWSRSSSLGFLSTINRPTLLVSAQNDPFLSEQCFPRGIAAESDMFYLETPEQGGHCAFPGRRSGKGYWHERRALDFIETAVAG